MTKVIAIAVAVVAASGLSATLLPSAAVGQPQAPQQQPPASRLDFANTKISELIKDPRAKAIMEKYLPELADHYDDNADKTLTEIAFGELDEPLIKKMQADYDRR
jgi:hypothetical protein